MQLSFQKKIIFTGVSLLLLWFFFEILLRLIGFGIGEAQDPREKFSSYEDQPWAEDMFRDYRELTKLQTAYTQYLIWRNPQFKGKQVNIRKDGTRKTWQPEEKKEVVKKVYMFGGSTMFGSGSHDEGTIPSFVAKNLNASGEITYLVSNYGQGGYSFSQEVLQLALLLRQGHRPDYVVFYDGGNDAVAAYDAGSAGAIIAEPLTRQKLEVSKFGRIWLGMKEIIKDDCKVCRAGINIARSFSEGALRLYKIQGMELEEKEIEQLADGVIKNYQQSQDLLSHLAEAYSFSYYTFWQPTIFGDELVGDEEKLPDVDWRLRDKNMEKLHAALKARLSLIPKENFRDLSDILRGRKTQYYLDHIHVAPNGNEVVALEMLKTLKEEIIHE